MPSRRQGAAGASAAAALVLLLLAAPSSSPSSSSPSSLAAAAPAPAPAPAAAPGCELSLTFFPEGSTNEPASLTKAGQLALKPPNKDDDQLLTVPIYGETVPLVHVAPVSPLTTLGGCVPDACIPGKGGKPRRRRDLLSSAPAAPPSSWRQASSSSAGRALRQSCPRTLSAAQYRVSYSFEGAPPAVAGPYSASDPAPQIAVSEVAQMPPGTWCADIAVALVPETARVTQYSAGFLPAKDQFAKRTICFLKRKGEEPPPAALAVAEEEAAAAPVEEGEATAAPLEEEAAGEAAPAKPATPALPGAANKPAASKPAANKPANEPKLLPPPKAIDDPKNLTAPAAPLDESKLAQASRYYCLRWWSTGGKDLTKIQVPNGDEGITACADACNGKGGGCQGFKAVGTTCHLMSVVNGASGKSDAAVQAACVKNATEWLAVGKPTAGAGFHCLANYDLAGDQAGAPTATSAEAGPPPPRPPGGLAKPEVATTSILLCAEQCRLFDGCQFFVQQAGMCYLKSNMIGGAFGVTGPSNTTLNTCIGGADTFTLFGGQLDYLLPPPTVDRFEAESTGLAALGVGAGVGAAGAAAAPDNVLGNATYYCLPEYRINGTLARSGQLDLSSGAFGGDPAMLCSVECDKMGPSCAAHITTQAGGCGLYSGIKPRTTGVGDPSIAQLCLRSAVDWDALGDPDDSGTYCLNKYDMAGDGVKDTDYLGIVGVQTVSDFCKAQCKQEAKCEFVVASEGKCYLKSAPLVGAFGRTGYSETARQACVRSPMTWMSIANRVSAAPMGGGAAANGTGAAAMAARRAAAQAANGAGGGGAAARPAWALAASWLVAAAALF